MPINPIVPAPQYAQWHPRQYEGLAAGVQAGLAIRRNKLAEQDRAEDKDREGRFMNALGKKASIDELYAIDPQRAANYSSVQAQQALVQQRQQEVEDGAMKELSTLAARSMQLKTPAESRAMVTSYLKSPRGQKTLEALGYNPVDALTDMAGADDQGLLATLQGFAAFGQEPAIQQIEGPNGSTIVTRGNSMQVVQPPKADNENYTLGPGQTRFDANGRPVASVAPTPAKPQARFRPLSPEEVRAANLPEGTAAQINDETGQISVVSRPDLSTIKGKVLEQQNKRAYDVYTTGIKGLVSGLSGSETGPIAGRMPAWTAKQQIASGSVAAMAPVLKQLFRSAGEGTFTDKDQDLLMEMLPTRKDEPEARAAKIVNIDAIVRAKLGMPTQRQEAPQQAVEYLKANPQLKGAFQQKYGYLPDGI